MSNTLNKVQAVIDPLTTHQTREIILQAAAFNTGKRHFRAIQLIHENIQKFDPDLRLNGLKEVLFAAEALKYEPLVRTIAQEIAKEDPTMPSIQKYLNVPRGR